MEEQRQYYELLQIDRRASAKEITAAYRVAALRSHPDKNPGDAQAAARFQAVHRAYQILSDEKARAAYDAVLNMRAAREERARMMAGRRADLRDELLRKEAEYRRQRQAEDEAERRLAAEIERIRRASAKKPAATFLETANRTLRLRWLGIKPLTETEILAAVAGIERVVLNRNRTGAELLFFSTDDADEALNRQYVDLRLERLSSYAASATSQHRPKQPSLPPFAEYEAQTLERLRQAASHPDG